VPRIIVAELPTYRSRLRRFRYSDSLLWIIALLVVAVGLYWSTVGHGFVFDDEVEVARNTYIRSLANLPVILSTTVWSGTGFENHLYRPLAVVSYALNYALVGLAPWAYHLTNVLLHGLVTVLVFTLGRRWGLTTSVAGVGALLFAVHPVHVEAVAAVVGRKELLAATFLMILVLTHRTAEQRFGPWAVIIPVLAFLAAMLSKEIGVVGIGLVAAQDLLLPSRMGQARGDRSTARHYAAYVLTLTVYLVARTAVVGGLGVVAIPILDNPVAHETLAVRWMTALVVLGKGLGLLAWPAGLSPDYSFNAIPVAATLRDWRVLTAATAICLLVASALRIGRAAPLILLAAAWYAITIFPASNVATPIGTMLGERLLYLPSVAFCLAAAYGIGALARARAGTIVIVGGLLCVPLAARTIIYAEAWSSELSLFREAVAVVPSSTKAHHKLSEALRSHDDNEGALAHIETALQIAPSNTTAMVTKAEILRELGRHGDAVATVHSALRIDPDHFQGVYVLGQLQRDDGDLSAARESWEHVLELQPTHPGALSDLGTLLALAGDRAMALRYWEGAVASDPRLASAWYNIGRTHEQAGDSDRATAAYARFIETAGTEYRDAVARIRAAYPDLP
jgi:Tfp pilus assembly protein PilF